MPGAADRPVLMMLYNMLVQICLDMELTSVSVLT